MDKKDTKFSSLFKFGSLAMASMCKIIMKNFIYQFYLVGLYSLYKGSATQSVQIDEQKFTKKQLLNILEELRIAYTPYYAHYYQFLNLELLGKPEEQMEKIREYVKDIHKKIVDQYTLEDEKILLAWINKYIDDPQVKEQIQMIDDAIANQIKFKYQNTALILLQ